jgi:hypothetical protein
MSNSKPMTGNTALATPRDEQPSSEWASTTLSALDPANDPPQPLEARSVPESPGVSMPGSFPIPKQGLLVVPDVQYVGGVASDALKSAKQYAQSAAQGAQTAVQSAGEKVGEYLPPSVTSYLCKLELFQHIPSYLTNSISLRAWWYSARSTPRRLAPFSGNVSSFNFGRRWYRSPRRGWRRGRPRRTHWWHIS